MQGLLALTNQLMTAIHYSNQSTGWKTRISDSAGVELFHFATTNRLAVDSHSFPPNDREAYKCLLFTASVKINSQFPMHPYGVVAVLGIILGCVHTMPLYASWQGQPDTKPVGFVENSQRPHRKWHSVAKCIPTRICLLPQQP